jgi:hypothetical protein
MPMPPQIPLHHPVPRRSRTLPMQPHTVVYHTYDAPRGGGPGYVMVPPGFGGAPPQVRMQSVVRILHSFLFFPVPNSVALTRFFFVCFIVWAGHANETVTAATQALVYKLRTLGFFLFSVFPEVQTPASKEAPEEK